jgi:hypothetical protein
MKISKILLILTLMASFASVTSGQYLQLTDDQDFNGAITYVLDAQSAETGIELATDGGVYYANPFEVTADFQIKAAPGLSVKPTIVVQGAGAEEFMSVKYNLMLEGVKITGLDPATSVYDSLRYVIHVSTHIDSMFENQTPDIIVRDCEITDVYRYGDPEFSTDGTIFNITTGGRAGEIVFENCILANTGDEALRSINTHKDPQPIDGKFCSSFEVTNTTFSNIRGTGIKIEGDSDSTNADPQILMENLTFDGCQKRVIWHRQMFGSIIRNILITNSIGGNDNWDGAKTLITYQGFGTVVSHIDTFNISGIKEYNGGLDTINLSYGAIVAEAGSHDGSKRMPVPFDESTMYNFDPGYADAANGDFTVDANSPILSLGHDGLAIGDRNWAGMPAGGAYLQLTDDQDFNGAIAYVLDAQSAETGIELATDGGVYYANPFEVTADFQIKAAPGLSVKPTIVVQGAGAEEFMSVKYNLMLEGVKITGLDPATSVYDSLRYVIHVSTHIDSMFENQTPDIIVRDCEITDVYRYGDPEFSTDGTIFNITTGGRAGEIVFENCILANTGDEALRSINTHKDPQPIDGKFCSSFEVTNTTFSNIRGTGIKIEGDSDSTNADPQILMENLTFDGCQKRVIWHRQMFGSIIRNILITNSIGGNDNWDGAKTLITYQGFGTVVSHIDTFNISGIKEYNGGLDTINLSYGAIVAEAGSHDGSKRMPVPFDESTMYNFDPGYADAANGDFTVDANSPILSLGHDGLAIGDRNWTGQLVTSVESDLSVVPDNFELSQNYPNPFNPTTQIQFSIPNSGNYVLKIYNILGQEVAELINGQLNAGSHTVTFDASRLSSGVYFYNFNGNNISITKKMMLLK